MSAFDDSDDNPFAVPQNTVVPQKPTPQSQRDSHNNPPAVLDPVPSGTSSVLDNFRPFDEATQKPRPPSGSANATLLTQDQLKSREAELAQREREQAERERRLREAEEANGQQSARDVSGKNWPPLPAICPVKPCFYQDIDVEIPQQHQSLVRIAYYLWLTYFVILILNILGAVAYLFADIANGASVFGFSLIFLVLFVPSSYLCWFRPLYRAFRSDSSFNFFVFFFIMFGQVVVGALMALGAPINACGWITALSAFKSSVPLGVFLCIIATGFSAITGLMIILLIKVHRIYRRTDASFEKAKVEFGQGVFSNSTVQQAAVSAVTRR